MKQFIADSIGVLFGGGFAIITYLMIFGFPVAVQAQVVLDEAIRISDGRNDGTVQEIVLKDGTKCAVMVGYNKGAISCDWKHGHD